MFQRHEKYVLLNEIMKQIRKEVKGQSWLGALASCSRTLQQLSGSGWHLLEATSDHVTTRLKDSDQSV